MITLTIFNYNTRQNFFQDFRDLIEKFTKSFFISGTLPKEMSLPNISISFYQ